MNAEERQQIQELLQQITSEPWVVRGEGRYRFIERPRQDSEAYGQEILSDDDYPTKEADQNFVVLVRQRLPALLVALEASEERERRLREMLMITTWHAIEGSNYLWCSWCTGSIEDGSSQAERDRAHMPDCPIAALADTEAERD